MKIEINNIPDDSYDTLLGKIVNAIKESGLDGNFKGIKHEGKIKGMTFDIFTE